MLHTSIIFLLPALLFIHYEIFSHFDDAGSFLSNNNIIMYDAIYRYTIAIKSVSLEHYYTCPVHIYPLFIPIVFSIIPRKNK